MQRSPSWIRNMAKCSDVYPFLVSITQRNLSAPLGETDLAILEKLGLIQRLTSDQYAQLSQEVETLTPTLQALNQEAAERARLAADVQAESQREHSIRFHLEGRDRQEAERQKGSAEQAALQSTTADLSAREQGYYQLVAKKSLLDTLLPLGAGYIGLTGIGSLQTKELGLRMYRVSDLDFSTYWDQTLQVFQELSDVALRAAQNYATLAGPLASVDPGHLWAISVGLAKGSTAPPAGAEAFLLAYQQLNSGSSNLENRLLAAEVLSTSARPAAENLPTLAQLEGEVRSMGVPPESSLGVASILLLGVRQDGTYATANLPTFLHLTGSYESAALLAIVNRPYEELSAKFGMSQTMFAGWGYERSEDVELSSAYLTVSDLPIEGVATKLAIIAKGMGGYLQYPLVASAILASIPVLEANETLNRVEQAYEIIGRRAGQLSPPELICLAVRMVHGLRSETVGDLDATAVRPTEVGADYLPSRSFYFVPLIVAHGAYYSTFSAFGGVHPGHAHFVGGFVG
jgi:hypothetical protein